MQLDHALQRPGGVRRGQRVAAVEDDAVLDLERVGPAVVGDLPALGDVAAQVRDVVDRVGDEAVVHVRGILGAGELEHLGRIERDQVGDLERHDQGVLRRRGGRGCRGQRQGSGGAEREASQLEHRVSLIGGAPHPAHSSRAEGHERAEACQAGSPHRCARRRRTSRAAGGVAGSISSRVVAAPGRSTAPVAEMPGARYDLPADFREDRACAPKSFSLLWRSFWRRSALRPPTSWCGGRRGTTTRRTRRSGRSSPPSSRRPASRSNSSSSSKMSFRRRSWRRSTPATARLRFRHSGLSNYIGAVGLRRSAGGPLGHCRPLLGPLRSGCARPG